ncbi:ROK family protein [Candidatus Bipolaricaulota bacterium]|nr:ROK family protein [Candidatus Bipolaricaulota bacterium]
MAVKSLPDVLRAAWTPAGVTRRELEVNLSLSRPTVDKALAELRRLDLVHPWGTRAPWGGRPAVVFRVHGEARLALGVDVELPRLEFVLTDLWGTALHAKSLIVEGLANPATVLRHVAEELRRWAKEVGLRWPKVAGIGLGLPAFLTDGTANFVGQTLPAWHRVPARQILEREFPIPVRIHHDMHLMALAEAHQGGWDDDVLLYFALRPGLHGDIRIGASVLVDGNVYLGAHGHGGALYRAFVEPGELAGLSPRKQIDLLVDRATNPLVHAVTLFDPGRVVIHAEMLGEQEPLFIEGCRRRVQKALEGEFPDAVEVAPARARGPTAALGAAITVVRDLYANPAPLLAQRG